MATIVMSAAEVIVAAEATIAHIKAVREKENKKMIAAEIKDSLPGLLRKLLGLRPLTEEQAIRRLQSDPWAWYPSQRGWGDLEKAKKLLKLTKHGDPVTLNQEDVNVLF